MLPLSSPIRPHPSSTYPFHCSPEIFPPIERLPCLSASRRGRDPIHSTYSLLPSPSPTRPPACLAACLARSLPSLASPVASIQPSFPLSLILFRTHHPIAQSTSRRRAQPGLLGGAGVLGLLGVCNLARDGPSTSQSTPLTPRTEGLSYDQPSQPLLSPSPLVTCFPSPIAAVAAAPREWRTSHDHDHHHHPHPCPFSLFHVPMEYLSDGGVAKTLHAASTRPWAFGVFNGLD